MKLYSKIIAISLVSSILVFTLINRIENKFDAKLTFVAPKGIELGGAVQFKIKADVKIPESVNVRAGYSANAIMSIGQKENILCINESLLQFNRITEKPFVEILQEDGSFFTKEVEVGISDGINVEILKGIKEGDKIKVWNSVEEDEDEDDDRREGAGPGDTD